MKKSVKSRAIKDLPLLLTPLQSAAYLGLSRSGFFAMRDVLPRPVKVYGGIRWRRADLEKWAAELKPYRGRKRKEPA